MRACTHHTHIHVHTRVPAQINYAPFRKNFYTEVGELARMSDEDVAALRKEMDGIKVRKLAVTGACVTNCKPASEAFNCQES